MDKEELRKLFEKNVTYMQQTIPPDDIYIFAEQTLMAALYFVRKLSEYTDLTELVDSDPVFKKWAINIGSYHAAQINEIDMTLDLKIDELDE